MSSLSAALPLLSAMAVLMIFSAFFSACEAALFSLRQDERRLSERASRAEHAAFRLLRDPERLLSAVLLWNLVVNVCFFVLGSIVTLQLEMEPGGSHSLAAGFALISLLALIFCSEMLPKTIAVLQAKRLARLVAYPLTAAVWLAAPLIPMMRTINRVSQRVICPNLRAEANLEVSDLERAITLSVSDSQLLDQEQAVLQNIVQLSYIRVDEWMRPRSQFRSFRPPVSLRDLKGEIPPSGYLLITEAASDEIEFAIRLREAYWLHDDNLERQANRVLYAPWCATMAEALEKMRNRDQEVTAVVNEYGETIGVLTLDDILEAIFTYEPSRSKTLLDQKPIHYISPGKWLVSGMTNLRRLDQFAKGDLPPTTNVTVSGVIQESLQRIAEVGDECDWGPFLFRVLEMPQRGHMLIEMNIKSDEGEQS